MLRSAGSAEGSKLPFSCNEEWGMRNEEWGMRNEEWVIRNEELGMRN